MRFQTRRRDDPTFNLSPLIDILFIVLIFLVLTTTFQDVSSLQINLPVAESGQADERTPAGLMTISVDAAGHIAFQGERVDLVELADRLSAMEEPGQAMVRLHADADVRHGVVVQILDLVRRHDIDQLSIETRFPE